MTLIAINLSVDQAAIERALTIARGTDAERAAFHASYIISFKSAAIDRIEIITEFRRVVLVAEDHIRRGNRSWAYSARSAQEAVSPWRHRVSVVAHLRFHPLNTYVDVPQLEIKLDGPNVDRALIGVMKNPILSVPNAAPPAQHVPLAGAVAEAVFDATLIGQTQRTASVLVDGQAVGVARLDFARVE